MVCNDNGDVKHGTLNDTTALFQKATFKDDTKLEKSKVHGCWVHSAKVIDIDFLILTCHNSDQFCGTFEVQPKKQTAAMQFPVKEMEQSMAFDATMNHMFFKKR